MPNGLVAPQQPWPPTLRRPGNSCARHARHRPRRSSAAEETTIAQYRALAVLASLLRKGLAAPGFARPSCTISTDA